jgi:hypothetical protein
MSWGIQISEGTLGEVRDALVAQEFNYDPNGYAYDEMKAQFTAVRAAALVLIDSGVIGASESHYAITMSGHGNPGHSKSSGWASEMVHITISEIYPKPKVLVEAVS